MRRRSASDLSTLARLAQNPAAELRPLLLRVQAQTFADAQRRDAAMVASFESIALGLIPLVADDVLSDIAPLLRAVPDTPPAILGALDGRLGTVPLDRHRTPLPGETARAFAEEAKLEDILARENPILDLAISRDTGLTLGGRALATLVDRAIGRRDLARALLARPELSRFDRAALYRHADTAQRAQIRGALASVAALATVPRPPGLGTRNADILRAADGADLAAIARIAEHQLGCDLSVLDLREPAGRELFALTLVALGLDEAECIRVMILLGTEASRSVGMMTELAYLVRNTPWPVAAFLTGRETARRPGSPESAESIAPPRAAGSLRSDGRYDAVNPMRRSPRVEPVRAPTARADRRP